jgi:hypothetical protein
LSVIYPSSDAHGCANAAMGRMPWSGLSFSRREKVPSFELVGQQCIRGLFQLTSARSEACLEIFFSFGSRTRRDPRL